MTASVNINGVAWNWKAQIVARQLWAGRHASVGIWVDVLSLHAQDQGLDWTAINASTVSHILRQLRRAGLNVSHTLRPNVKSASFTQTFRQVHFVDRDHVHDPAVVAWLTGAI